MPIYAYKCASCGHAKDVLQKLSDSPLTRCPACGAPTFTKQVTAAGFQLKGSGWYATDFRNGSKPPAPAADGSKAGEDGKPAEGTKPVDGAKPDVGAKPADAARSGETAKPAESAAPASKPPAPAA